MMGPMWVDGMIKGQKHWFYSQRAVKSFKLQQPFGKDQVCQKHACLRFQKYLGKTAQPSSEESWPRAPQAWNLDVMAKWTRDGFWLQDNLGCTAPQGRPRRWGTCRPVRSALCRENRLVRGSCCGRRSGVAVKSPQRQESETGVW